MQHSPRSSAVDTMDQQPSMSQRSDDEDTEDSDEHEIVETSENGRWQKSNQKVTRNVPGIDSAFLAMDTDDAREFVWNEVRYSNRKGVTESKKLVKILTRLTEVKHNNIVNFIDFWNDRVNNQDRLVFITEYMTSGSLLQFLEKAKLTMKTVNGKMWKRWCRQILAALSYLHKHEIVHGNLSLASIFIQHSGVVKIGSVSPDAIHKHVKTNIEETSKRLHYTAPEYVEEGPVDTAADIYSFGMCALEMLNLDLLGIGDNPSPVKKGSIVLALDGLMDPQRGFIDLCIREKKAERPTATALVKHPALQVVFDLTVLSACALNQRVSVENIWAEIDRANLHHNKEKVLAEVHRPGLNPIEWKSCQSPKLDLEYIFEEIELDVVYHKDSRPPATQSPQKKGVSSSRTVPTNSTSSQRNSSQYPEETRKVSSLRCSINQLEEKREIILKLVFEDHMERELTSELKADDEASSLAWDLVMNGLVSERDKMRITDEISEKLRSATLLK